MADQCTMAELLRAPTESYAEAIVVPPILAEHFELKHSLINMMTSDQFFRLEKDNPHDHIRWFNKITSTIKYKDVPNSAIKLMIFPFSLAGAARRWLKKEPPHSILTWEDLVSKFINEFFPPSRTTNLRNEISNFQQKFDESFHEAWDRYKDLLRACPRHAKLTHAVNQQTSVMTTAMTAILKQFQATPPPASVKAVEEIYVTCGGPHPYYQYLTADGNTFPEYRDNIQGYVAAAMGNYNQGNAGYRPPAPIQQNQSVPLNELEKIRKMNDINIKAMQTQINNVKNELRSEMQNSIQTSMSNQTNELKNMMASFFQMNTASTSGTGSLLSNTVANPKGELKAITTRSGLVLDGPSVSIPPPFINPEEDERVEETLTDPEHGSGYHQKDRKPSQNDKTEHGMEKTVQNQGQSPKMPKSESKQKNQQTTNLRNEISNFQQKFDESFHEAWDRYKDLLRACPHHGFTELHQLDTFYNALNPADQDSLNSAAGGNLLERSTQDVLTIIENKSKVRNSRNKSIVSQVKSSDGNSSSSDIAKLTHAVNQQTSVVTTAMTAILKQFQATPPPASVKAVEEVCVTCGGAHPYYQCLAADGNTFPEYRDNIQGYVAAAAGNYNQGNAGYRPQASMSNQTNELKNMMASFFQMNTASTSGMGSLSSNTIANPKGELKAITTRSGLALDGPTVPMPPPFINPKEDERVEETLTDPDHGEYTIKDICTPKGIARDVFVPVRKFTFPVDFVIVDYESDPRVPLILGRPFLRTARALIDVHGEEMILHDGNERLILNMRNDTSSYSNEPYQESINMIDVYNVSHEEIHEDLFATNHPSGNPTSSLSSHTKSTSPEVVNHPSGNPTPISEPETKSSSSSPTLISLEESELIWEEFEAYLASDSFPLGNSNPSSLLPPFHNSLSGSTTSSSPSLHISETSDYFLEEFADELAPSESFPPGNDDMTPEDVIKEVKCLLTQSPLANYSLDNDLINTILEMFTDEHALDYSSPPLWDDYDDDLFDHETVNDDTYDDPFDFKEEKIKDSKILIDELDLPESNNVLPFPECDSVFYEDFSKVDALFGGPSTGTRISRFLKPLVLSVLSFSFTRASNPQLHLGIRYPNLID
ncbi:reverse transcriptase domain-containing protein [Tanacetum coccineum]|uniref:Reverse transcriptase domain-containing protein n=1 Tax=Tanacetum coccineum TaxID=301880 RepID=A0ABQ4Y0Z7_9ASTR